MIRQWTAVQLPPLPMCPHQSQSLLLKVSENLCYHNITNKHMNTLKKHLKYFFLPIWSFASQTFAFIYFIIEIVESHHFISCELVSSV